MARHEISVKFGVTHAISVYSSRHRWALKNFELDREIFANNFRRLDYVHNSQEHIWIDESKDDCLFKAEIIDHKGSPIGVSRINACDSVTGVLYLDDGSSYNINQHNETHSVIYPEDMLNEKWACGSHSHSHHEENFSAEVLENGSLQSMKLGRNLFDSKAQSRIKFIKLLIVNDHAMFQQYGENTNAKSAQLVQRLQGLYDKFATKFLTLYDANDSYSIKISLAGMITFKHEDPWSDELHRTQGEVDAHRLLNLFSEWKSLQIAESDQFPEHSVAHLISGLNFEGGTVGLANLFAICKPQASVAINQANGFEDETVATIMAHELAHNMGVYHTDTTHRGSLVSSPCGGFIMDSNGIRNTQWSKCSVNYLKMFFDGHPGYCTGRDCTYSRRYGTSSLPACLEAPPTSVWSLDGEYSLCGNGIRENDEQCDCGQKDCSDIDPCCDGATCTFADDNFECSNLDPCCENCYISPKSSLKKAVPCRDTVSLCDLPEYCDGQSAKCPFDGFERIGTKCFDEELDVFGACFIKNCNSHARQCLDYKHLGYDSPCITRDGNNGDIACGDLYCHRTGTPSSSCEKVYVDNLPVKVLEGTKCGKYQVCDSTIGKCVDKSELEIPVSLSCSNGIQDADETDIDCGGPRCFPCSPGDSCLRHSDCYNNDCVNSSITTASNEQPVLNGLTVEPENGCTSVKTEVGCAEYNGCIWLEEYTRCKKTGEYPPSGNCFSQEKRQSCINFQRCEWDFQKEACVEILGEIPVYGYCSGDIFYGIHEIPWWRDIIQEFEDLFEDNSHLGYTLVACSVCSLLLCAYAIINFLSRELYSAQERRQKRKRRITREQRKATRKKRQKEIVEKLKERKFNTPECKNMKSQNSQLQRNEKSTSREESGESPGKKYTKNTKNNMATTNETGGKEVQHKDTPSIDASKPDVSTSFTANDKASIPISQVEIPTASVVSS